MLVTLNPTHLGHLPNDFWCNYTAEATSASIVSHSTRTHFRQTNTHAYCCYSFCPPPIPASYPRPLTDWSNEWSPVDGNVSE